MLWPLLGSALLVGTLLATEMGRLYRVAALQPGQRFGRTRSSEGPQAAQQARSLQPGRGRHASTPWQIPLRGWKDILWRTYERIGEDRLLAVAAGVVFYGLLALFPAVTALVSLYGLFAQATTINEHLSAVTGLLPDSAVGIVQQFGWLRDQARFWIRRRIGDRSVEREFRHEGDPRCPQCRL